MAIDNSLAAGDTDNHAGAGQIARPECGQERFRFAHGLERGIDTKSAGDFLDRRDRIAVFRVDRVRGAETSRPLEFRGSISTAMMVVAPASFEPMMTESPTPPQPTTATD